jgi:poly(hydroxyalkanoate) depolymerase family esterase
MLQCNIAEPPVILPDWKRLARLARDGRLKEAWTAFQRAAEGHAPARQPSPRPASEGRFVERSLTGPAGTLGYKLYIPARGEGRPRPLLLMLHGCTQSPDDFAAGTGMNRLAEAQGIIVAYPRQTERANVKRCWNWFEPSNQARSGELALFAALIDAIAADEAVDRGRVFAAGLSAGGAAAVNLAAAYPELLAGVGAHSGLACGVARDVASAFRAMKDGGVLPAAGPASLSVPTIVFQGDKDATVHPANAEAILRQAKPPGRIAGRRQDGVAPGGLGYTRTVYDGADGRPRLESWVVHGGGHAWSGGSPEGSFTEPRGPDASRAMLDFFAAQRPV